jgi:hypothetical protein
MLADRNAVAREFSRQRDWIFYPVAFSPVYGPTRERKNGQDECTLERKRTKHGLRRQSSRKAVHSTSAVLVHKRTVSVSSLVRIWRGTKVQHYERRFPLILCCSSAPCMYIERYVPLNWSQNKKILCLPCLASTDHRHSQATNVVTVATLAPKRATAGARKPTIPKLVRVAKMPLAGMKAPYAQPWKAAAKET